MKRHYTRLLFELLDLFPCVAILGVRQCGKTTLLGSLPRDWRRFDLEQGTDLEQVRLDPDLFLRLHPQQVAIDEAQVLPALFPALRVAIDSDRSRTGRFVITGSSSPDLLGALSESLAGRVAIIEMAPFAMTEAYAQPPSELYRLVSEHRPLKDLLDLPVLVDLHQRHQYWLRGGYPEPWVRKDARYHRLWMQNYVQTYLDRDLLRLFPKLDRPRFRQFLQMLAYLSGTLVNYAEVARALGVSQPTARDYFQIAQGTFIWRHLPAYERDVTKRVVKHPKGHLRDSGLLHHLLHLADQESLRGHPQAGNSWESMIVETLLRGFQSCGEAVDAFHYRTAGGAEVDLILEGGFGLLPVEIKYGQHVSLRSLRGLRGLVTERNCPYGLVIYNDEQLRLYDERIIGVPAGCL